MAREVFTRKGSSVGPERLSVSTATLKQALPELVDPDEYAVKITEARLTSDRKRRNSKGNVSIVLTLVDSKTEQPFDTRPLWIDGPNASVGNLAPRNYKVIVDLLAALGIDEASYTEINDDLLAKLIGKSFEVELDVDRGRNGRAFNYIARVIEAITKQSGI
jgi:hypothetical protein